MRHEQAGHSDTHTYTQRIDALGGILRRVFVLFDRQKGRGGNGAENGRQAA